MTIQGVLNHLASSEHVFDMDAVPEPVPVESDVVYGVCQNCNCSIGCVIIVNCDYTGCSKPSCQQSVCTH